MSMSDDTIVLGEKQNSQLKACEFEMLKAFVSVCEVLDLRYFIAYGTLLGAVRHKGFIPWDDDIDVTMPREDYDRFVAEAQKLLPEYYFIQTHNTDSEYPLMFAKIRDSRTTYVERLYQNINMNHGVYIDIFPLDFYPETFFEKRRVEIFRKLVVARVSLNYCLPKPHEGLKDWVRKWVGNAVSVFFHSTEYILDEFTKIVKKTRRSQVMRVYGDMCGKKLKVCWYEDSVILQFEGLSVSAPKGYQELLECIYGAYMELPPVEQRKACHSVIAVDIDVPYSEHKF